MKTCPICKRMEGRSHEEGCRLDELEAENEVLRKKLARTIDFHDRDGRELIKLRHKFRVACGDVDIARYERDEAERKADQRYRDGIARGIRLCMSHPWIDTTHEALGGLADAIESGRADLGKLYPHHECTCVHSPEQHLPEGCSLLTCSCRWDGKTR